MGKVGALCVGWWKMVSGWEKKKEKGGGGNDELSFGNPWFFLEH